MNTDGSVPPAPHCLPGGRHCNQRRSYPCSSVFIRGSTNLWFHVASGRAGGGLRQSRRYRGPYCVGEVAGGAGEQQPVQLHEEAGEAAAIGDDGVAEFVPECPIELAGRDAEV